MTQPETAPNDRFEIAPHQMRAAHDVRANGNRTLTIRADAKTVQVQGDDSALMLFRIHAD